MADWKQITARIRRAKGSKDPAGQLCNLFQKTRDAMVAFELARHLEIVSKPEDAAKWYALSWQRFRRGDWKTKAQDAITRLGGTLPAEGEILAVPEITRTESSETQSASFSSESETPVTVEVQHHNDSITVAITNHGEGIPNPEQSRIFDRLYRSPSVERQIPGSGLGLSIAMNIVRAHHGDLRVTSRPGETTFRMTLPAEPVGARK